MSSFKFTQTHAMCELSSSCLLFLSHCLIVFGSTLVLYWQWCLPFISIKSNKTAQLTWVRKFIEWHMQAMNWQRDKCSPLRFFLRFVRRRTEGVKCAQIILWFAVYLALLDNSHHKTSKTHFTSCDKEEVVTFLINWFNSLQKLIINLSAFWVCICTLACSIQWINK